MMTKMKQWLLTVLVATIALPALSANIYWSSGDYLFKDSDESTALAEGDVAWLVYLNDGDTSASMFDGAGAFNTVSYTVVQAAAIGFDSNPGVLWADFSYTYDPPYITNDKFVIMAFNEEFTTILGEPTMAPTTAYYGVSTIFDLAAADGNISIDEFDITGDVSTVNPVPEPGTMALFGLGCLTLALRQRRRKKLIAA
jgi:hypothetical protein